MAYDKSGSIILNTAHYADINKLKMLYRNLLTLEKAAGRGNEAAMTIYIDLKTALEPSKRITTKKQKFFIIKMLIENYTLEELVDEMKISRNTILSHVKGGLKRISKALVEGEVYSNKYEYILANYSKMTAAEIGERLGINKDTVKSIYHKLKKQGDIE